MIEPADDGPLGMADPATGFVVLYRWKVDPETEGAFLDAWTALTGLIRDHQGGRGSRLHRGDDGIHYGYAQWPDRKTWETRRELPEDAVSAQSAMNAAVIASFDPILLDPIGDLLLAE